MNQLKKIIIFKIPEKKFNKKGIKVENFLNIGSYTKTI
jgi:hypothetical protein